jgi:phosphoserine aminotransferase
MKKHNFNAGPSILPQVTLDKTAEAVKELDGIGMSILEISHRSPEFQAVMDETVALFKELLDIPEGYQVLFVGGGASTQFFHIPYNFLNKKAAYLNTGAWSTKAIKEAKLFGEVVVVASSEDKAFTYIPKDYTIPTDADYFYITTNNTIRGTEIKTDLVSPIPLVADMSSDIFSRAVDVSKYGLIYGGAQKNLAPAGVTFVIVKEDLLGKAERPLPTMVDYRTHIKSGSLYNTPPVICIYSMLQTLKWLKGLGGVDVMNKMNVEKASMLYDEIDRNRLFRGTVINAEDRSLMNVTFVMNEGYEELADGFVKLTKERGMVGVKGHRDVGGFRASLYNALPKESVAALIQAMRDYEAQN